MQNMVCRIISHFLHKIRILLWCVTDDLLRQHTYAKYILPYYITFLHKIRILLWCVTDDLLRQHTYAKYGLPYYITFLHKIRKKLNIC